jgi:hypothetical protein
MGRIILDRLSIVKNEQAEHRRTQGLFTVVVVRLYRVLS